MSIFLYFLFASCGLYVWVCTSRVSYNPTFNTPLWCNSQTACFCWISCLSFLLGDRSLAFPPRCLCQRDKVSWGMPVWAKNDENVEELLRLDRRVQGVSLEFVAIDSILLEAQWRITLNVTQIGRADTVRTVYQHKGEHCIFIYAILEQDMVLQLWKLHFHSFIYRSCTARLTLSLSPPPFTVSVSSWLPMRVPHWWLQVKHFGGGSSNKRSMEVLFHPCSNLSPSPTTARTARGY